VSRRDWYSDLMNQSFEGLMEYLLKDSQKVFRSEAEKAEKMFRSAVEDAQKAFESEMMGRLPQSLDTIAAYHILGLEKSASDEEIKKRYRDLAKRLHPDVAGKETEHLFKLVQAAYEQIKREREII